MKLFFAVVFLAFSTQIFAEIPVIDDSDDYTQSQEVRKNITILEKVNALEEEMQKLRGELEVQSHLIKQLSIQSTASAATIQKPQTNALDEQISYLAAYDLVKNKKYRAAKKSLLAFIAKNPQSSYVANANYWLGELNLLENHFDKAKGFFKIVITKHPLSTKAADSQLKLAYAQAATGEINQARSNLEKIIASYPDTRNAKLAREKLEMLENL